MRWQTKAIIQRAVAALPPRASGSVYYAMQRCFGGLRSGTIDPTSRMRFAIELCEAIARQEKSTVGKTFLEVGTGWRVNMPLVFWLCGAKRVVTLDLNHFLKIPLICQDIQFLQEQGAPLREEFAQRLPQFFDESRWNRLANVEIKTALDLQRLFDIEYHAPADAADTALDSASIDYHVSCNVLEHIPAGVLTGILNEANRIVRPDGLVLHRVDHTDHFSHSDPSISPINFLQYGDRNWDRLAQNRYAYVNRLREDDYVKLFDSAGHHLHEVNSEVDPEILGILEKPFQVGEPFRSKSADTLARLTSVFVSSPASMTHANSA